MTKSSTIEDLLDVWERQQENGNRLPPEEFILHNGGSLAPEQVVELRRALLDLESMDRALGIGAEDSTPGEEEAGATAPSRIGQTVLAPTSLRVERLHARGGLGEVYVAADEHLGPRSALKMIQSPRPRTARAGAASCARPASPADCSTPASCPSTGAARAATGHRFTSCGSYRAGRSRKRFGTTCNRPRGTIPGQAAGLPAVAERFVSVCDTIAYAHSRGVVHRDLKPSNIMVGRVRRDAGRRLGPRQGHPGGCCRGWRRRPYNGRGRRGRHPDASRGAVLGTPAYMSPEQAGGLVEQVGPSCDVYGLGAVLYTSSPGVPR